MRFKLDPTSEWDEALVADLAHSTASTWSTSRRRTPGVRPARRPAWRSTGSSSTSLPAALIEDPGVAGRREGGGARATPRAHHVGCRHPFGRRHRRAAVPAARAELQAVEVRFTAASSSTSMTPARSGGSACTAAVSSSSGRDAARSSTSPRSFIPKPRTTSRPAATTSFHLRRGCRAARCRQAPEPIGFRWLQA